MNSKDKSQTNPQCTCWKNNKKLRKYTVTSECPKHKR